MAAAQFDAKHLEWRLGHLRQRRLGRAAQRAWRSSLLQAGLDLADAGTQGIQVAGRRLRRLCLFELCEPRIQRLACGLEVCRGDGLGLAASSFGLPLQIAHARNQSLHVGVLPRRMVLFGKARQCDAVDDGEHADEREPYAGSDLGPAGAALAGSGHLRERHG